MSTFERVENEKKSFVEKLQQSSSTKDLENLRVVYLGKKGFLSKFMEELKTLPHEQKKDFGRIVNEFKFFILDKLEEKKKKLSFKELGQKLAREKIDPFLPGAPLQIGALHPLTQMMHQVRSVLHQMGFSEFRAPELDNEYNNYTGLNYPADHPARDMQDTYYIDEEHLLRSHNTTFQQRIMKSHRPPIRSFCMGKCYRNETISSRSHVIFHQVDVLYIDKNVSMRDLIATKKAFYDRIFHQNIKLRTRPSYFPFVEPGIEIDIHCMLCNGKGCRLCKETGWLEVCGAGMVHPEVLIAGGIDPDVYSGFAWGGGIERLYLMMHQIDDIRLFLQNDLRFLRQFM